MAMFVAAGLVSGVAAVLFHEWILVTRDLLLERALETTGWLRIVLLVAIPAGVAGLIGVLVDRFAPRTIGANFARVRRAYLEDVHHLDKRTILSTFFLTPLSLGSGAPLGPEGPTVIVTSGLSVWVARALKLPRKVVRGMVPVGTAAGIAAIFRTPITGVVFALEELFGTSNRSILGGTLIAAVAAAVVQHASAHGNVRVLPASAATWTSARELIGFAIVGVCAGIVSGTVLRVAARMRDRMRDAVPSTPRRFAIGGAAVGLLGVMSPMMFGVGYDTTSLLLQGGGSLMFDAEAFGAKTLGFAIAASAGLLGGTFAPSLFIGASLGGVVGQLHILATDAAIHPGAYALVGMGAYFAGTLRAPIAAVLIVIELTNDYGLVVPLMLAVALSNLISHAISPLTLEEDQLEREGVRHAEPIDPLTDLLARDVMTTPALTFRAATPMFEVVEATREERHQMYPVVDDQDRLVGVLAGRTIARLVRQQKLEVTAADLMDPPLLAARIEERMHDLLDRMAAVGTDRCPVVDAHGTVVGFLSPTDLVRARFRYEPLPGD